MRAPPKPNVSAIIIAYRAAAFIGDAIDSVLEQTVRPTQIIVVHDGPDDGTSEIVRRYGPEITYEYHHNRLGEANARNTGIALSRGEYIAFLDADDLWDKQYLQKVMTRFAQRPGLGLVFAGCRSMRPPRKEIWVKADPLPRNWLQKWHFSGRWVAVPSTTVIRRSLCERLRRFDESLISCVDQDLYLRAMLAEPYDHIAEPLVTMRRFGSSLTSDLSRLWRANRMFYKKHRYTFGRGLKNWLLWHKAKSNCRRQHAWAYVMRRERVMAAIAACQALLIWPFERPGDWVRLGANILFGEYPSRIRKFVQRFAPTPDRGDRA